MGLYLAIFTIFSIVSIFALNKKFSIFFSNYYLIAIFGILFFIYFWIIRYQEDIMNLINGTAFINGINNLHLLDQPRWHSIVFSKALFLDLCPFIAMVFTFLLTFDKEKNVLKVMAPYAFFGGCITIFGQIISDEVGTTSNNLYTVTNVWDFIFGNKAYFTMHYFAVIVSLIILMNSKGFGWRGILGATIFPLTYFSYILIIVNQFNIIQNATGLVPDDWSPTGQYWAISKIFSGLSFPATPALCYALVYLYVLIWISLRNTLIHDDRWKQSNMLVYKKKWTKNKNKESVFYIKCLKCQLIINHNNIKYNHLNCSMCQKENGDFCNKKCFVSEIHT